MEKKDDDIQGERPQEIDQEIHQVQILHLSDLHFGSSHFFVPELDPQGNRLPMVAGSDLLSILSEDVASGDSHCPALVALTGDFTTKNEEEGFAEACEFVRGLGQIEIFGKQRADDIVIVPGNHDVNIDATASDEKWIRWSKFYANCFGGDKLLNPLDFVKLIDRSSEGLMILTVNSSMYVQRGKDDQWRGQIDEEQLEKIYFLLESNASKLKVCIRIALIHHHPVLVPALAEGGKGYDAVIRGGRLLNILNKHGFHLILHGHKHWPCVFSVDNKNAYDEAYVRPMLAVSGGSIGSRELPFGKVNCYNKIWLKWNSRSEEIRIRVESRGLITEDEFHQPLPSKKSWHWGTLRIDDRIFYRNEQSPRKVSGNYVGFCDAHQVNESLRKKEYNRIGLNMPVVEVMPSFVPFQKYEAVFWIVPHKSEYVKKPLKVVWSAGPHFPVIEIFGSEDARFCGAYAYYGPMLIQAAIYFEGDSLPEFAYVYARLPSNSEF